MTICFYKIMISYENIINIELILTQNKNKLAVVYNRNYGRINQYP